MDFNKKKINQLLQQYVYSTPQWKAAEAKLHSKYSHWNNATGLSMTQANQVQLLADALSINQLYKIKRPKGLTEKDEQEIIQTGRWMFISTFKNRAFTEITGRLLLESIADQLHLAQKQKKPLRSILFFSHDRVIATVITLLGASLDDIPRYAADLNFSLFKQGTTHYYVKVTLNGQPLPIPGCQLNVCTLEQMIGLSHGNRL